MPTDRAMEDLLELVETRLERIKDTLVKDTLNRALMDGETTVTCIRKTSQSVIMLWDELEMKASRLMPCIC